MFRPTWAGETEALGYSSPCSTKRALKRKRDPRTMWGPISAAHLPSDSEAGLSEPLEGLALLSELIKGHELV